MDDSPTERCMQSLHRANMEFLDISVKTFFEMPIVRERCVRSAIPIWLDDEELVNSVRKSFKENIKLDEKVDALKNLDSVEQDENSVATIEEKLNEKKDFLESKLVKVKEEVALLESPISLSLNRLESSQFPTIKRSLV